MIGNRRAAETERGQAGWSGMIPGAMRALILFSAFVLGAMPPIPRGIGIGESFTRSGCCSIEAASPCGSQQDCPMTSSCSSCAKPAPAPSDCQRCVCCLCGIGLPVVAPEIHRVEIVMPGLPEIEGAWFSILLPPAPPPPEVLPLLSFA